MDTLDESTVPRSVLEESIHLAMIVDDDGIVRSVDGSLPESGSVDSIENEPLFELIYPADREDVRRCFESITEGNSTAEPVRFRLSQDGEVEACLESTLVRSSEEKPIVTVLSRDVTGLAERANERERFAANLEQLHEAANRLYDSRSVEECLDVTIDAAVDALGFDWCVLTAPARDEDVFEVRAVSEGSPLDVGERTFELGEGLVGQVYETKEPLLTDDVRDESEAEPTHDVIRSVLTVPIGEWGVFQALSTEPGTFDERDRALAETLVAPAATAIGRLMQTEVLRDRQAHLERQVHQIEALHDVATAMKTFTDRQAVYDAVVEASEEILEFDVALLDEVQDDVLKPMAVSSQLSSEDYWDDTPVDSEESLAAITVREEETYIVRDAREDDIGRSDSKFLSVLSVPLADFGVFQAASEEPNSFDETDQRLTELLIEHAVAAVGRIEREREIEARAAALETQNERLDQFASILSHDIRTPLSVATGYLEVAREERDGPALQEVADALVRIDEMVEDVLELAREGEADLDPVPVAVATCANSCWDSLATEDASLTIESDFTIVADQTRFERLLENLVRNAIEHVGEDVTVTIGTVADGFYVEDDGPGIPEEEREDIFELGHTGGDGTGLGLAIVESLADGHGWTVAVTEGTDGGARFEFRNVEFLE